MAAGVNKEYAGIAGLKDFVDLSLKFAYGDDSKALQEKRVAGVQVCVGMRLLLNLSLEGRPHS